MSASAHYGWGETMRTYYYGNDYVVMARQDPVFFGKLYRAVVGLEA